MAKKKETKKKLEPFKLTFPEFLNKLPEKINCVVCGKEFETCAKCFKTQTHGKGKTKWVSGAIAPFLIVGRITTMNQYPVACKTCSYKILRVAGQIPEKYDSKVFPQVYTGGMTFDEFKERLDSKTKKRYKQFICYKGKRDIPHTKALYDKYLAKACRAYLTKFPETPYNLKQLKRQLKSISLKSHPLEWE